MKRRSAAALLLTLGLAIGGNSMILAAEPGETVPEKAQETPAAQKTDPAAEAAFEKSAEEEAAGTAAEEKAGETAVDTKADGTAAETKADETGTADTGGYVSRIVSFTDSTGMRVTYDANVSLQYVYEVEDGILKTVRWKETDTDEKAKADVVKFEGNVELRQPEEGEKYVTVAADVFGGNTHITYVKLPAGVTTLAEGCFEGCTGLKGVYLPSTVKEIGAGAFEECTAMTQISLPKSVAVIGDYAFKGDVMLEAVQIRDAADSELTSVGTNAFEGCRSLQQMTLPQTAAIVGEKDLETGEQLLHEEETR